MEFQLTPASTPSPTCTPRKRKPVELEEDNDPDEDTAGAASPTAEPRLYHFKATFDQLWDYPAICKKFFLPDRPYLAVKEHPLTNAHVHFQGYALYGPDTFDKMKTRLAKTHHLRKESKHCRPVLSADREVTDVGFQYCCKDLSVKPLAVNMFTPDELVAMRAASTYHVKELKTNLSNYVGALDENELKPLLKGHGDPGPEDIINAVTRLLFKHQKDGKLTLPKISRHTRDSIKNGLMQMPRLNDKFKALIYVSK